MKNTDKPVSIFWFRRDLRLHDNHALYEALKSSESVLPIFIFDKNILDELTDKKDKRLAFIHHALAEINKTVSESGASLYVLHSEPLQAFKTICETFSVQRVYTNHDYEPYAIQRDKAVEEWLKEKGISFHSFKDQVIFEKSEVMKADGTPYTIFTPYSKIWKQHLNVQGIPQYPSEKLLAKLYKEKNFKLPTLKELGFESASVYPIKVQPEKEIIQNYHNTRNIPSLHGTSNMSVQLRFGTVSVRNLVAQAKAINETWLNELIWREFFMMILFQYPQVVNRCFKPKYENIKWRNNKAEFDLWCKGETGYPIVDAGMRELNETGLMHNRIRMVVASFLTKHLLIDWRWGEAYFAEKLLDYELSSNNGNWQWAAGCGCDAAPYFRVFNPSEQTRKFDPQFLYIKKWVKNMSANYAKPIVEHDFARKRALATYKEALREE